MKNRFVVGLVNVLVGRFVKLNVEGDEDVGDKTDRMLEGMKG